MPGWHDATREIQKAGKVKMIGIIQEQHPERARLFMQWKQMVWPILIDPLNLLGVAVVPITLFIDEYGIIRKVNPRLSNAKKELNAFLATNYPQQNEIETTLTISQTDSLVLWQSPHRLDEAISLYTKALESTPGNGALHFRLGVAYRMRYDASVHHAPDFSLAVENWARALKIDPNQYIWRRRIQQYGPRLDKPYPFYDWVVQARREITVRGQTPVELSVKPGGAEFAQPLRTFESRQSEKNEPDPAGRIIRDSQKLIEIEQVVVRSTKTRDPAARVHVVFKPNSEKKAHWNNEAGQLVFWLNPQSGWQVDTQYLTVPNPKEAVSLEIRKVEFEIRRTENAAPGSATLLSAYALYYVCEDVNGVCLYRRQDVAIHVR